MGFLWGNLKEIDHLGHPGMNGRIILKMDHQDVGYGGVGWIQLAQDRDSWRALLNAVMNHRVP